MDETGHHVGGQGKWGNCGPGCPIPPDDRNKTAIPGKTDEFFTILDSVYRMFACKYVNLCNKSWFCFKTSLRARKSSLFVS